MKKLLAIHLIIFLLLSVMFLFTPSVSYACSCAQQPDAATALEKSVAVFAGKVLEVKQERKQAGITGPIEYRDVNLFEVETLWKGTSASQIIVYDNGPDESCGFVFEEGKSYIVYAYSNKNGELFTSFCSRTAELSKAGEDIKQLGQGVGPKDNVDLGGKMDSISNRDYDMEIFVATILVVLAVGYFIVKKSRT